MNFELGFGLVLGRVLDRSLDIPMEDEARLLIYLVFVLMKLGRSGSGSSNFSGVAKSNCAFGWAPLTLLL